MYKDVWKRFGVKVLIILCSVLLLGGVAIAAPRLKAVSVKDYTYVAKVSYKFDVEKLANESTTGSVGAPITRDDILTIDYYNSLDDYNAGSKPLGTLRANDGDYVISSSGTLATNVGSSYSFEAEIQSNKFDATDTTNVKLVVEKAKAGSGYDSARCYIKSDSQNLGKNNVYFTQNMTASNPFISTDAVVKVTVNGTEYTLPTSEYNFLGGKSVAAGEDSQFKVDLNNIDTGMGTSSSELSSTISYNIRRKMSDLTIKIKNLNVYDGFEVDNNDKAEVEGNVTIWDGNGSTQLSDFADKGLTVNYNTGNRILTITSNGTYYQDPATEDGSGTLTYKLSIANSGSATFRWPNSHTIVSTENALEYGVSGDSNVELWNGFGYAIIPQKLAYRESSTDAWREVPYRNSNQTLNYEVTAAKIVNQGDGATAGEVEITIQGKAGTEYASVQTNLRYYVKRSLNEAEVELIHSQKEYVYTNDSSVRQIPDEIYIKYTDQDRMQANHASNSSFFECEFRREDVKTTDYRSAGEITVAVIGKGTVEKGGYLDEAMTASYEIQSKDLSKYTAKLSGNNVNADGWQRYIYTGNPAPVTGSAVYTNSNEERTADRQISIKNGKLKENEITTTYRKQNAAGQWEAVDEAVEVGKYEVTYHFRGNYKGTVTANFEIYTHALSACKIVFVGGCSHNSGGSHVYDKSAHEPEFKVVLKSDPNEELPRAAYTDPEYVNNTNAGTATVTIKSTASNEELSADFKIEEFDLSGANLTLPSAFSTDQGVRKHIYVGKNNKPALPSITVSGKKWSLEKGVDYVNGQAGSSAEEAIDVVAYDEATKQYSEVDSDNYPRLNQKYAFRIRGIGNYKGTAYTELFELDGKPISDVSVTKNLAPKPRNSGQSNAEYAKGVAVVDTTFGETLIYGTDFEIDGTVPDKDTDGKVTFTIKGTDQGCYIGTDTVTFNYGEALSNALIFEPARQQVRPDTDGKLWFSGQFSWNETEGKYNNIEFLKKNATGGQDTNLNRLYYLAYPSDRNGSRLYFDEGPDADNDTYYVKWNAPTYADDGYGEGVGSVIFQGQHGFYGEVEVFVHVSQAKLDSTYEVELDYGLYDVDPTTKNPIYTGQPIYPDVKTVVKKNAQGAVVAELTQGTDFEVRYPKDDELYVNINAGSQAVVYIQGINSYSGEIPCYFTIEKRDFGQAFKDGKIQVLGLERPFDFATSSIVDDVKWPGVRPTEFVVQFNWTGNFLQPSTTIELVKNTDYSVTYANVEHAWENNANYDSAIPPTIKISSEKMVNSNFKGSFDQTFEIAPMDLSNESKCEVRFDTTQIFTGKSLKPSVTVWYNGKLIENYDQASDGTISNQDKNYTCDYDPDNTTFVGETANQAFFTIKPTNKSGFKDIIETREVKFNIVGDLEPKQDSDADLNSELRFRIQPVVYQSADNPLGDNPEYFSEVRFYQQKHGEDDKENNRFQRQMLQPTDYTVEYLGEKTVGPHIATVKATDGGRLYGTRSESIIIQGDLSNKSVTTYNGSAQNGNEEDPVVRLSVTSGSAILDDLVKAISPVWCGGRKLEYDKDYILEGWDDSLGVHSVIMKKKDDTILYLDKQREIRYEVTQGINGLDIIGLKDRYEYAHGDSVINTGLLRVELDGKELQSEDYTINLVNDKEVTTENGGYIEIIGQGKYSGKVTKRFTIYAYDLSAHNEANDIEVDYTQTVGYTGSEVFPDINSILVKVEGSTQRVDLTKKDPVEYMRVGYGVGDRVNYTKDGETNLPTCHIVGTNRNYTGFIELTYRITRQGIADESKVVFDPIDPQKYLNGREITPSVRATNVVSQKTLIGVPYGTEVDENSTNADFTYQYGPDCRNAGEKKVIYIRGIGNYTGTTEVYFDIIPKNIGDDDVTVELGDTLTYNGKAQIPAFVMKYANDDILSYNGSAFNFLIMRGASIEKPMDNTNAGRASFTIVPNDTNYTGERTVSFRIEPASLADHTKFMYQLDEDKQVNLVDYKLNLPWEEGVSRKIEHPSLDPVAQELAVGEVAAYYSIRDNSGVYMLPGEDYDYSITRMYVEPDSDDVPVREGFGDEPKFTYAGKVKVTIEGRGNYVDSASYWYYIGTDISDAASIRMEPTTTVYNSQVQTPTVKVTGVDDDKYTIAYYKNEAVAANRIEGKDFVNAATYYVRVEGNPSKGTYATKPHTLTYTITPRPISNSVVIDGFKKEYPYTGLEIRPVGISVTDYIDRVKYRLTEDLDYTLSYSNNLNAGTAFINVECKNNFSGTARANFLITSSTISSGSSTTPNTPINGGTGEISGSKAISPNDVILTMDTANAMHYTGNPVYPKVSIAGMTENVDYTVTFSNNTEVGTATVTITGIGNNRGTITKTFNIIAPLSNCKIAEIPAQQYTGSAVEPTLTVTCGKNILIPGTDYNVTYANNINIGTATATIRAASNSKYTGSASVTFSIANDVGDFIISGYAPTYTYTGNAITPSVVVETGSGRLTQGTDYTISYSNNINAGKATITVKGVGRYSGTKTATFIIEAKSIQGCTTTEVEDRTYTGDAYTPTITVTDGNKVLTSGVDYTVTYTNNTEPGTASILIQGMSNNYSGTKVVNFKIGAVAVKGLKATKVKYNSLKLKWTKQGYADGYQICDAQSKVVKNVTKNSVTLKKLATGKTYRYKVRSYIRNADGTRSYGAFSSVVSATTKLKTPEVEIVSKKTGQARITWSKVSGANGYEIYYKKSSGETYRKVKTVNNANVRLCRVRGMKSGDKAYFRVRAFKKTGSKKVYSSMNKLKVITVK